jgi:formylglycine-generating enzyme required for sulfatase activity
VVGINWYEANAYCKWLTANFKNLPEGEALSSFSLSNYIFRLPVENEWLTAAGGLGEPVTIKNQKGKDIKRYRFPWDPAGHVTPEPQSNEDEIMRDILRRANIYASGINRTTPASMYPLGRAANGLWDMAGNVWEWQANYFNEDHDYLALRGGSWNASRSSARVSGRRDARPLSLWNFFGFRVCLAPPSALL